MRPIYDAVRSMKNSSMQKKQVKDAMQRAGALAEAQRLCGPGLYVDTYLRHFVQEYNGRIFKGEGANMPNSWNIMQSFLEPDEQAMVLKLLPQQYDVLSFNRMLDHLTHPQTDLTIEPIARRLEELKIYNINMLGGYAEFKIPGSEQYVFCGLAACREDDELSLVGVFGRANPKPATKVEVADRANLFPGKQFLFEGVETVDMSDEALFGDSSFVPIILMARLDVTRGTIQVRYVLEETKDTYKVISDDPQIMEDFRKFKGEHKHIAKTYLEEISEYDSLFELMSGVPSCIDLMEGDDSTLERHPTELRLNLHSQASKRASELPIFEAPRYVNVRTLFDLGKNEASYELRPSNLTVETAGYWRTLRMDAEGRDKNGQAVQGKTWVTTQVSWFERVGLPTKTFDQPSKIEPSERDGVGYLYVMRNATHPRDVYKVGFTMKDVEGRARQLSATTGQPDMFNVIKEWRIKSPKLVEHEVHEMLKEYRINRGREFFNIKYPKIREAIERVIEQTGAAVVDSGGEVDL
jgi:hypothetical protein